MVTKDPATARPFRIAVWVIWPRKKQHVKMPARKPPCNLILPSLTPYSSPLLNHFLFFFTFQSCSSLLNRSWRNRQLRVVRNSLVRFPCVGPVSNFFIVELPSANTHDGVRTWRIHRTPKEDEELTRIVVLVGMTNLVFVRRHEQDKWL